jgi:prephenate dehydrogenase
MKIAVVGLGLIGGSAALDLRRAGFASRVTGVEANAEHARQALDLGLVDAVAPLAQAVAEAELVVLAVPVTAIAAMLPGVLDIATGTVTDMGSTKAEIGRAVEGHPQRHRYVAAHPMAGTEHSGPAAAHAGLFAGKVAILCDRERSGVEHLARVEALFTALGMRLTSMGAADHDLHVAYVSHLSHVSSFALATAVLAMEKDAGTIFDFASGGFASTVRLAKSSPAMWGPIFEQNAEHVSAALAAYIAQLREFQHRLSRRDFEGLESLMREANRIRPVLDRIGKEPKS